MMSYLKKIITNRFKKLFPRCVISQYRQRTSPIRALPDFMIIGAQKSGTTSLYRCLSQHPQLTPSYLKEVHFFDGGLKPGVDNFNKGEEWYRSHFPLKRHIDHKQKVFEASPLYIFNPLAPRRISELVPEVKIIAILRDPVERAISHYFHEKRKAHETLPIMDAFLSEEERLKPAIDRQDYKNETFIHCSYKKRGRYHEQLKRYLQYFPMHNLLVIKSEAFFKRPHQTLRRVFRFLDVDTDFAVDDLKPRNVGSNKDKIDTDVYEYLEDYYQQYNQDLYELLELPKLKVA